MRAELTVHEQECMPIAEEMAEHKLSGSATSCVALASEDQLLRLQKQFALEMEMTQTLREENALLKTRVAALMAELERMQNEQMSMDDMKNKMTWLIQKLMKTKNYNVELIKVRDDLRDKLCNVEDKLQQSRSECDKHCSKIRTIETSEHDCANMIREMTIKMGVLEEKLNTRNNDLEEAERVRDALVKKLDEVELTYATKISTVQSSAVTSVSSLEEELAYTKATLANCIAENKNRVAELEQELDTMTTRARNAELDFHEEKRRAVELTAGLRGELGETSMRVTKLTEELKRLRGEHERTRQRNLEDKQKYDVAENKITQLTKRYDDATRLWEGEKTLMQRQCDDLREVVTRAQAEAAAAQRELAELRAQEAMTGVNAAPAGASQRDMAPSPTDNLAPHQQEQEQQQEPRSGLQSSVIASNKSGGAPHGASTPKGNAAPTAFASSSTKPVDSFAALPAFSFLEHRSSTSILDTVDTRTRARVQKELIRLSMELEQSRLREAEMIDAKSQLADLRNKHDILLQMYGQLMETVNELQAKTNNDNAES